jgi:hypothetical protein
MIQDYEINAWLGPAADDLTPEQRAEFCRLVRAHDDSQRDRDHEFFDYSDDDDAAWVAAYEQATA